MPPLGDPVGRYWHGVWRGKTRMVWLLDFEKNLKVCIRFDRVHERDGQTDGRTPHDAAYRPRLCIALRRKTSH